MKKLIIIALILTTACASNTSSYSVSCPTFLKGKQTYTEMYRADYDCNTCSRVHSVQDGARAYREIEGRKFYKQPSTILSVLPLLLFL